MEKPRKRTWSYTHIGKTRKSGHRQVTERSIEETDKILEAMYEEKK